MNDIWSIVGPHLREPIVVVDAGAMDGTFKTAPERMPETGGRYRTFGFEPLEDECALLNQWADSGSTFLPYALGDGTERTLHRCRYEPNSSLYEPDAALMGVFQGLAEQSEVVSKSVTRTVRLDDIPEITRIDFFKSDVQGAELDIFRGAERLLATTLLIEVEVEFVPLYKRQPLFADVDAFLRARGFAFHFFPGLFGRAIKPLLMRNTLEQNFRQTLWGDAVYVPAFDRLPTLAPVPLMKLAALLHDLYQSYDLAHLALSHADAQTGGKLAPAYFAMVQAAGASAGVPITRT
jgi:FkbM family methyltransferase